MAFGDIIANLGLVDGRPDEGQQAIAQMLLERRGAPAYSASDQLANALAIGFGAKMVANITKAAERERTREQKDMATAMGINPLAYEANETVKKMRETSSEAAIAHEAAGQFGILSSTAKAMTAMPMIGGPMSGMARSAIDPMQARAAKEARVKSAQSVAMGERAAQQFMQQETAKQQAIQRLMQSRDPAKVQFAMQQVTKGAPEYKIAGNKVVKLYPDGSRPPELALDLSDQKPIILSEGQIAYHPDTGEELARGGVKGAGDQLIQGVHPQTGQVQWFSAKKDGSSITPLPVGVKPNIQTQIIKEGEDPTRGDKPLAREFIKNKVSLENSIELLDRQMADIKPEYFNIASRMGYGITEFQERLTEGAPDFVDQVAEMLGAKPSKEDLQELRKYKGFEGQVQNFNNRYIKEITGAQMSEPEAQRIIGAIGDMGNSFSAFLAKRQAMRDLMQYSVEAMERRLNALVQQGLALDTAEQLEQAKEMVRDSVQAEVADRAVEISLSYQASGSLGDDAAQPGGGYYDD